MKTVEKATSVMFNQFANQEDLISALADRVVTALRKSIAEEGQASLAVSGGRSPVPLFQTLAKTPLPWEKVTITLIDERWVPRNHDDSNEKLVRDNLIQGEATAACFIPLKNDEDTPQKGEAKLNTVLAILPKTLTIAVLGMGEDGHTASFFPHAETLRQALDLDSGKSCQWIEPRTASHSRMTLTLPRILASREVILHISGKAKKLVYDRAMNGNEAVEALPVKSILNQLQSPVNVYWAP